MGAIGTFDVVASVITNSMPNSFFGPLIFSLQPHIPDTCCFEQSDIPMPHKKGFLFLFRRFFVYLLLQKVILPEMKKAILLIIAAFAVITVLQGCQSSKHHGYVSNKPCHQMHPCSH